MGSTSKQKSMPPGVLLLGPISQVVFFIMYYSSFHWTIQGRGLKSSFLQQVLLTVQYKDFTRRFN